MKTLICLSFVFALLILNACGAQGGRRNLGGGGRYCPENQQEVLEDFNEESLIYEGGSSGIAKLPLGNYEFESASYFYKKKVEPNNSRRWIMFQIDETLNVENEKVTSRYCVRGLSQGDPSIASEVPGIEKMTVGQGRKVTYSPRLWGFSYNSQKLMLEPPFCADGSPTCNESQKTSFANKIESGKFIDHQDVFDSFADDVTVVQYPKDLRRNVERFGVIAKAEYNDEDGRAVTQLLKITYVLKRNSKIFPVEPETRPLPGQLGPVDPSSTNSKSLGPF